MPGTAFASSSHSGPVCVEHQVDADRPAQPEQLAGSDRERCASSACAAGRSAGASKTVAPGV